MIPPGVLPSGPWLWLFLAVLAALMAGAFSGTIWLLQHGHARWVVWGMAAIVVALIILISIVTRGRT